MLSDAQAVATVAVRDLDTAKRFYAETLGLEQIDAEGDEAVVFRSGRSRLNVYRSKYAGTNKATAVTWDVGDQLDEIVRTLKGRGVSFERYELPGMKHEGDIHVGGDMRVAWFKDPDGNILNVMSDAKSGA
jgi:catechol 2,3-dioxygenase-like lactoylglutathione lyase family enzyme